MSNQFWFVLCMIMTTGIIGSLIVIAIKDHLAYRRQQIRLALEKQQVAETQVEDELKIA